MNSIPRPIRSLAYGLVIVGLCTSLGCEALKKRKHVKLDEIYSELAQLPDYVRNPVIVVPGILGSRLIDGQTGEVAWGEMGPGGVSPRRARSLAELALPMQSGVPLHQLHDNVKEDGPLDQLTFRFFGIPIRVNAYAQILATMGVGGYRDQHFRGDSAENEVSYGDDHFTCFQFAYDWRRDVSETAVLLHDYIEQSYAYAQQQYRERYGIENADIKFDLVAHSMGGLVARYYLRYGNQPLPDDGSLPKLTWAGAHRVGRVLLVGTPNLGSTQAIVEMKDGMRLAPPLPKFPAAVIGTMPAAYQLFPRSEDQPVVMSSNCQAMDILAPETWEQLQWGLADPKQDKTLRKLMPNCSREQRRAIALEHQFKCLVRARQFHAAMDFPAEPPEELDIHLYAGDAMPTLDSLVVDTASGKIEQKIKKAGDGTVSRTSALSERKHEDGRVYRLIPWHSETFLSTDHLGLTRDRTFVDNVLNRLLSEQVDDTFRSPYPYQLPASNQQPAPYEQPVPYEQPALNQAVPYEQTAPYEQPVPYEQLAPYPQQ